METIIAPYLIVGEIDSSFTMVIKQLKQACHRSNEDPALFKEISQLELKRIDVLKLLLVAMKDYWDKYSDLLKAYDELVQCKSRLMLMVGNTDYSSAYPVPLTTSSSSGHPSSTTTTTTTTTSPSIIASALLKTSSIQTTTISSSSATSQQQLNPYELSDSLYKSLASAVQSDIDLNVLTRDLVFYRNQVYQIQRESNSNIITMLNHDKDHTSCALSSSSSSSSSQTMIVSDESSSSSRDLLDTTCHTQLPKNLQDTCQPLTPIKSSTAVTRVDAVIPTEKEECLICREVLYNISCNDDDDDDDDDDRVEEIVVMLPCAHRYVVVRM